MAKGQSDDKLIDKSTDESDGGVHYFTVDAIHLGGAEAGGDAYAGAAAAATAAGAGGGPAGANEASDPHR